MRYWSRGPTRDVKEARALLEDIRECFAGSRLFQWGVARVCDDVVLGTCTLSSIDAKHKRAEIGYALARAHWGTGVMSEAQQLLLGYAFDTLQLHRIEADVDPRNL